MSTPAVPLSSPFLAQFAYFARTNRPESECVPSILASISTGVLATILSAWGTEHMRGKRRVVGGGGGSHLERRGLPVSPELVCCLVIICFAPVSFMSQNSIMIHRNNLCEAWQRIPRFIWLFVDAGGSMAWAIPTACHHTTTLGKLLSNL